ncbi:MAG: chromosome partitioning protein ParB [Gemmatimonadetes bacterium]|nr:chromosome partitioning protein ParB [Gemmatimonadota bacterium]
MPKAAGKKTKPAAARDPRGLAATALVEPAPPAEVARLIAVIETDGGRVIGSYRDPLGGHWQVLAGLPIDKVAPTPYQRDLSETHVARLADAIERLGRFVDPIVAVRTDHGGYWTPNGNHRLAAMRKLGAKAVVALVMPDRQIAHRILVLNTEKAHNVRERAMEVIRLAEALVDLDDRPERDYETEFEEPSLLTLGLCYQRNGRFSGGAYHPILKRTEQFSTATLSKALQRRRNRADRLIALDTLVAKAVAALKERGLESPYLKAFVIARLNPLRFKRGAKADPDDVIEQMTTAAAKFDVSKVKPGQIAAAGGPPDE